jgi:hypothetical protein
MSTTKITKRPRAWRVELLISTPITFRTFVVSVLWVSMSQIVGGSLGLTSMSSRMFAMVVA